MNSARYWAYRDAGAFGDDYDPPDEPERRTRCTCGAFLPSKPTFEGGIITVARDYGWENPETGEYTPDLIEVEEWHEPSTDCRKCKRIWTETEMWQD